MSTIATPGPSQVTTSPLPMSHEVEARVTVASAHSEPASPAPSPVPARRAPARGRGSTMPPASGDGLRSRVGDGTARRARSTASSMTSCAVIEVSTHVNPPTPSGHSRAKTCSVRPSGNVRTTPPSALVPNEYPDVRDVAVPRRIPPVRRRRRHPPTRLRRPRHPIGRGAGFGRRPTHSTVTVSPVDGGVAAARILPSLLTVGASRALSHAMQATDDHDHSVGARRGPFPRAKVVATLVLPDPVDVPHEDLRPIGRRRD